VAWSEAGSGFARQAVKGGKEPHDQYRRATTIKSYDFQQSLFEFCPRYRLPTINPIASSKVNKRGQCNYCRWSGWRAWLFWHRRPHCMVCRSLDFAMQQLLDVVFGCSYSDHLT
jgi:hypothetical protein